MDIRQIESNQELNIERDVRQGCSCHVTFGLSTIPLIKEDKRITEHITKHFKKVKIQSFLDDTTIIINKHHEIK